MVTTTTMIMMMTTLLFMPTCTQAWSTTSFITNRNHMMTSTLPSYNSRSSSATVTSSNRYQSFQLKMIPTTPSTTTDPLLLLDPTTTTMMVSTNVAKSILYDTISSLAPIFGNSMYDIAIGTSSIPNVIAIVLVLFGATPFVFALSFGVGKLISLFGTIENLDSDDDDDMDVQEEDGMSYNTPPPMMMPPTSSSSSSSMQEDDTVGTTNVMMDDNTPFPSGRPPAAIQTDTSSFSPPSTYLPYKNQVTTTTKGKEEPKEYLDLLENKTFKSITLLLLSIPLYYTFKESTFYSLFYSLSTKFDSMGSVVGSDSAYTVASKADSISYVFTLLVFGGVFYGIFSALIQGGDGYGVTSNVGGAGPSKKESDVDILTDVAGQIQKKFLPTVLVLIAVILAVAKP